MSIIEKINIESGSIASPSIIFRETTTGLSANGGDLSLSMGGVEKLKLSNAGILSLPGYSGNNGKYLKMDASGVLSADTPGGGASGSEAVYSGFAIKQDGLESATTSVYASKINKNITLFFAANQVNLSATTNTIKSRIFPNDALYPNMSYNYSKPVYINNNLAYARFVQNYNEYYLEFFTFPTLAWDVGTPVTIQPFTITYVGANNTALTGTTWGTTYFDNIAPTITAFSIPSPITTSGDFRTVTITFSENVYNFTIDDLIPIGGTLSGFNVINGSSYSVVFTSNAITPRTLEIIAGQYTDVGGNTGPGQTLDLSSPTSPPSGPILWVDGSNPLNTGVPPTNGTAVTTWYDKSGNSNDLTAEVNGTYSSNSQNGLGTITFSSSVYHSTIRNISYYPIDGYFVVKLNSLIANDVCGATKIGGGEFNSLTFGEYTAGKWHNGSNSFVRTANTVASVTETSTNFLIMSWSAANNNFYIYRNGTQISITSSYSWLVSSNAVISLGTRIYGVGNPGNRLRGSIAEAILYTSQLNTTNRQLTEGYLANKWGLKSLLPADHPYKA
jgi:hypothetical protein